jgi:hypothetical protein
MIIKKFLAVLFVGMLTMMTVACEREGPAEKAGEQVDKTMEKAGEQMEESGEKVDKTLEQTGKQMEESGEQLQK